LSIQFTDYAFLFYSAGIFISHKVSKTPRQHRYKVTKKQRNKVAIRHSGALSLKLILWVFVYPVKCTSVPSKMISPGCFGGD